MDQVFVNQVAAAVKSAGRNPEAAIAQLFAAHSPDDVVQALKCLSQEIQAQLSDRLADWAEYKAETQERGEFLREQADYFGWKADAARYREGINAALRAAKALRHALAMSMVASAASQSRPGARADCEGYAKGARVIYTGDGEDEGEDVGTILEVNGRSVWVVWDKNPDLPVQYASPWRFSVIEILE